MRASIRFVLALASCAACSALPVRAAPEREAVRVPTAARAQPQPQPRAVQPAWVFDEYLELHRQAGQAVYAPPSETVLTKSNPPCPRTRASQVN